MNEKQNANPKRMVIAAPQIFLSTNGWKFKFTYRSMQGARTFQRLGRWIREMDHIPFLGYQWGRWNRHYLACQSWLLVFPKSKSRMSWCPMTGSPKKCFSRMGLGVKVSCVLRIQKEIDLLLSFSKRLINVWTTDNSATYIWVNCLKSNPLI